MVTCEHLDGDDGCFGGNAINGYRWIKDNYITDETCAIYQAKDNYDGIMCDDMARCKDCQPGKGCFVAKNAKIYGIESYGTLSGEESMMNEIYNRGPIACSIWSHDAFHNYTSGVYRYAEEVTEEANHEISVVGWGVDEAGAKYWIGRNSWGQYWGENGMFKLARGENNILIESSCSFAVPLDTWTNDVRN